MIKPVHIKLFTKNEDSIYVGEASKLGLSPMPMLLHVEGMNPNKPQHAYAFTLVTKSDSEADYIAQPVPLWQGDNRPKLKILNA